MAPPTAHMRAPRPMSGTRAFLRQSRDTKNRSDGYDDVLLMTAHLSGTARRHVARRRRDVATAQAE